MDSIAKLFQDPTWWFTAVFVGILASVIAGYLRDGISAALGRVSTAVRAQREKSFLRDQKRVQFLAANPSLLVMEMVGFAISIVVLFALFIAQFLTMILGVLTAKESIVLRAILTWGGFVVIACVGFTVGRRWSIVSKAYREYWLRCRRAENAETFTEE